jgi:CubicO group peptidase (beta-lactamase class C family)
MADKRLIESSYLARYFLLNAVDISDHLTFPSRAIQNAAPAFHFAPTEDSEGMERLLNQALAGSPVHSGTETMDEYLERNGTVAFLVIQHDRILYEQYYNGYHHDSICTSFSTAKSFVSALIGIALHEKLIHDIDDPLTKYLPELTARHWPPITIRHLISMAQGLATVKPGSYPGAISLASTTRSICAALQRMPTLSKRRAYISATTTTTWCCWAWCSNE